MALITKTFGLLSLLVSIFMVTAAQPARHRVRPRYRHPARGINAEHVHRHETKPVAIKDDTLYSKYKSKLALQHTAISLFDRIESAETK